MKNTLLNKDDFVKFRRLLFEGDLNRVVWRDVRTSCIIPAWGEAVCLEDVCHNGKTGAQIAYGTIKAHYPEINLKWRKEEIELINLSPPRLFNGFYDGELHYVDIKAAYCTLYRKLFLHSEFPFKRMKYPLQAIADDLVNLKIARNAVVGIAIHTHNKWVQGKRVWRTETVNKMLSPTLWGQLQGILTELSVRAIDMGAEYINTDGFVFRKLKPAMEFSQMCNERGLTTKIDSGEGYISGINCLVIKKVKEPKGLSRSDPVDTVHSNLLKLPDISFIEKWVSL